MKPALFLDRDGIINIDYGYVNKIENFEFNSEIFDLIRLFVLKNYYIIVVTNQSGIGRGYYTLNDFLKLTNFMKIKFKEQNIFLDSIYYCPHAPEVDCNCRKPNTGMIKQACRDFEIDLEKSWMVGDKQSDIDLAINASIGTSVAISKSRRNGANYNFNSIKEFKEYLEQNIDKIL